MSQVRVKLVSQSDQGETVMWLTRSEARRKADMDGFTWMQPRDRSGRKIGNPYLLYAYVEPSDAPNTAASISANETLINAGVRDATLEKTQAVRAKVRHWLDVGDPRAPGLFRFRMEQMEAAGGRQ